MDSDYSPLSNAPLGFDSETYANFFLLLIGLLWNWQQDSEMKEGISKGMNIKWSLYMSSNQQNLTIGSIGLKSDYRVVKISLTTGLGSYPDLHDATDSHWSLLRYKGDIDLELFVNN